MSKYALFGCRIKNGAKELEGGWHDCLMIAESIEELKANFRVEQEKHGITSFNEVTQRHERTGERIATHRYFLQHRIDWYQIVDLSNGEIVEEITNEE